MDLAHHRDACDLLYFHWEERTRISSLPNDLRPVTREEGYAIQAHIERHSAEPLYGWKIAATSAAGMAHIGVEQPLAGRILAERVLPDGGTCFLKGNNMRVAELEFAFRMGKRLSPRHDVCTIPEIIDAVETLHPAIEIPDARFEMFETVGEAQLIADNACAHQFVLGPSAPDLWRDIDLASYDVEGRINDGPPVAGCGSNVLGDPRIALQWLVNELHGLGLSLEAGQVVTTGTCIPPMAIAPGDRIAGDFGILGRVALTFG